MTLSRDLAELENSVPWGRINPRRIVAGSCREDDARLEETVDPSWSSSDGRGEGDVEDRFDEVDDSAREVIARAQRRTIPIRRSIYW